MFFLYLSICFSDIEQSIEPVSIPLSISIDQMNSTGPKECAEYPCDLPDPSPSCGKSCWQSELNSIFCYFVGVKFQIFGTYDPNHENVSIFLDDVYIGDIDQRGNRVQRVPQYTSDVLPYSNHTVRLTCKKGVFEIYKLTYWPSITAKRINITEINSTGSWKTESDSVGGLNQYSNYDYSTKTIELNATKFWIFGSHASWMGTAEVTFGSFEDNFDECYYGQDDQIQLRNELVYESPTFQLSN